MPAEATDHFEIQGSFEGFFRDVFGHRRMTLRVAGEEVFLKTPKDLRKELDGTLIRGQQVVVAGRDLLEGKEVRKVSRISLTGPTRPSGIAADPDCNACPLRVCLDKSCSRGGASQLLETLERKIAASNVSARVKLETVDCLGHCKHGPNLEFGSNVIHRCKPADADRILAKFTS